MGFGNRTELDSYAIDVSFLNYQFGSYNSNPTSSSATSGSLLKLEGLYYLRSKANTSPYFGGGVSYGNTTIGSNAYNGRSNNARGSGLQGELSAGYEIARTTSLRVFVQADASLPFYYVTSQSLSTNNVVATSRRYTPSFVFSLGLGWIRNHR